MSAALTPMDARKLRLFLDDLLQFDTPERQRIRAKRQSLTDDFVTGDIVRFLPDVCHISATAELGTVFHTNILPMTQPVWEEAPSHRSLVGMADDAAPSYTRGRQARVPTAGGEVTLHPKFTEPYYILRSITKDVVPKRNVIFIERYATELARLELARTLIQQSIIAARAQLRKYATMMQYWRNERRKWELKFIVDEWKHGDMNCLSPKLNLVHLVDAKAFVLRENRRDDARLINIFTTGRYRQTARGKQVVVDGDDGGHFTNSLLPLQNELNEGKMTKILDDLNKLINNLPQRLSTANAMFSPVTSDNTQGTSTSGLATQSGSNRRCPGDVLTSSNVKRVTRSQTKDSRMLEAIYQSYPLLRPPTAASTSVETTRPDTTDNEVDPTAQRVSPFALNNVKFEED